MAGVLEVLPFILDLIGASKRNDDALMQGMREAGEEVKRPMDEPFVQSPNGRRYGYDDGGWLDPPMRRESGEAQNPDATAQLAALRQTPSGNPLAYPQPIMPQMPKATAPKPPPTAGMTSGTNAVGAPANVDQLMAGGPAGIEQLLAGK